MRAGDLRHQITIERAIESQNEYGEPGITWDTVAEVWAGKSDLSGRELFQAQQVNASVTTRFTIRHLPGIIPKMRVTDLSGTHYDIVSVQDADGRERKLSLVTSRMV